MGKRPSNLAVDGRTLDFHRRSFVFDGLAPYYVLDEPYSQRVLDGGVNAANLSIASVGNFDTLLGRLETALQKIEDNPLLMQVRCADDLRKAQSAGKLGLVFVTQNAEMLGRHIGRLGILYRLGLRSIGLTYSFANLYADGCAERRDAGLTFLGRELIAAINEYPMMLDMSHSGHRSSRQAVDAARQPVFTHANAYGHTANDRNVVDDTVKGVAAKGGLIGVCALPRAVKPDNATLEHFIDHIDYLVELVGIEAVGLGLDFTEGYQEMGVILPQSRRNRTLRPDIFGSVDDFLSQRYPEGIHGIRLTPNLTRGLFERGYSQTRAAAILGGNWLRVFRNFCG